jgi:large subunit ribosomal protein L29
MKNNKTKEYKSKTVAELEAEFEALVREQFNLKVQKCTGNTPRAESFKNVRRNIARIKTILSEKARESHD